MLSVVDLRTVHLLWYKGNKCMCMCGLIGHGMWCIQHVTTTKEACCGAIVILEITFMVLARRTSK